MFKKKKKGAENLEIKLLKKFESPRTDKTEDKIIKLLDESSQQSECIKLKFSSNVASQKIINQGLLHLAVIHNFPKLISYLLEHWPDLASIVDSAGKIPLHYAVSLQRADSFNELLMASEKVVNWQDNEGNSALHVAVNIKDEEYIKELVRSGANIKLPNVKGYTPLYLANNIEPKLALSILALEIPEADRAYADLAETFPKLSLVKDPSRKETLFSTEHFPGNSSDSGQSSSSPGSSSSSPVFNTSPADSSVIPSLRVGASSSSPLMIPQVGDSTNSGTHASSLSPPEDKTYKIGDRRRSMPSFFGADSGNNSFYIKGKIASDGTIITLSTIENGNINSLKQYLNNEGNPNQCLSDETPLILQTFLFLTADNHQKDPTLYSKQFGVFNLLLSHANLEHGKTILQYFNASDENCRKHQAESLLKAMHQLKCIVSQRVEFHYMQLEKLEPNFLSTLTAIHNDKALSCYDDNDLVIPEKFDDLLDDEKPVKAMLKKLCAELVFPSTEPEQESILIAKKVAALSSFKKPHVLMKILISCWEEFNIKQKLIANLLVKEILMQDLHLQLVNDEEFIKQLNALKSKNMDTFGNKGVDLNKTIEAMCFEKKSLSSNAAIQNYQTLERWFNEEPLCRYLNSFDQLVKDALDNTEKNPSKAIKKIAEEIHMLILFKFQQLDISNFYDKSWLNNLAPTIKQYDEIIKNLGTLIEDYISTSKPEEKIEKIKLFILVCVELCHINNQTGPNLCAISVILSALDHFMNLDLQKQLRRLAPEINEKYLQLTQLVSALGRWKYARLCEQAYSNSIPHLARIKARVTSAYESYRLITAEENPYQLLQSLADPLYDFLRVQIELHRLPSNNQTDIYLRVLDSNVIDINDHELPALYQLLSKIEYTKKLPRINYMDKIYEPHLALYAITQRINEILNHRNVELSGMNSFSLATIEELPPQHSNIFSFSIFNVETQSNNSATIISMIDSSPLESISESSATSSRTSSHNQIDSCKMTEQKLKEIRKMIVPIIKISENTLQQIAGSSDNIVKLNPLFFYHQLRLPETKQSCIHVTMGLSRS